jgi:hypothetical protein
LKDVIFIPSFAGMDAKRTSVSSQVVELLIIVTEERRKALLTSMGSWNPIDYISAGVILCNPDL